MRKVIVKGANVGHSETLVLQKGKIELPDALKDTIPEPVAKAYAEGKPIGCDNGGWFVMPTRVEGGRA